MNARLWKRRGALGLAGATMTLASAVPAGIARPAAGQQSSTAQGRLYAIGSGRHRVVVAGVAATLLSWCVDDVEQLLTHSPREKGEGYQGKTITPWPNRIAGGRYTFRGEELQVPINESERGAALHGLTNFVEWELVEHRRDRVVLRHELHPHYGYPFHLDLRVTYEVTEAGVRSTWHAQNIGTAPAPFGTANHTYLHAGANGKIDGIEFELPAETYYRTDENLIPTGKAPVAGTEFDFRTRRALGSTVMDTAFTDLDRTEDGHAVIRVVRPHAETIELWVDRAHGYLQVYTDDEPDAHRPRSGITVEPMTCAPNAFATGDGLLVLDPAQSAHGTWGYRAIT